MDLILNYDEIVSKFNLDLVNKLRKHGSEVNYLNLWVPDEDFFRSFKSLSESIKAAGVKSFTLDVDKKYLKSNEFKKLQLAYPNLIIERNKESNLLYFKNLESFNIEKKIVDQVVDKNQCIVQYIYGSTTKSLKNEHLKGFFVDFYKNNLSFFQGCVVKYVCRYLHKDKIKDLEKIIHYCELEILKLKDTRNKK